MFIVGQPRSGSSILYRLVQEHPRFEPKDGINLTESRVLEYLDPRSPTDPGPLRGFGQLDDEAWSRFQADIRPYAWRRRLAPAVPRPVVVRSPLAWSLLGSRAVLRSYMAYAAEGRGVERLVEKTPTALWWSRHLVRTFPDASLLTICRHPLPTYASFLRRAREDPEARWGDVAPAEFVRRWRDEVDYATRLAGDRRVRMRIVRYEDLVADAERFQRDLFAWLHEDPLDRLPEATEPSPFAPRSDANQLYGTIRDLHRDWRTYVTDEAARDVEAGLAAPMDRLGYEPLAGG